MQYEKTNGNLKEKVRIENLEAENKKLQEENEMMKQCLMEMSQIVYQ